MTSAVVVIGAINVDLVVAVDRLPGPGETVVGPGLQRFGGGKGANAAVAAARVGATVRYVGAVGADDLGRGALDELRAEGIDVDAVSRHDEVTTGAAVIVVDAVGENQIAVGAGANGHVDPGAVRAAVRAAGVDGGVVLISTEIPDDAVRAGVQSATELGLRIILNPAPVLPAVLDVLEHGPLLTPNAGELADLARALGLGELEPIAAAHAVGERTGAPVIVTLGGDGVLVVGGDQDQIVPSRPVTVRDTTGAGDTFNGVLAARLAAGDDLEAAAALANHAAGISVGSVGARPGMPNFAVLAQSGRPAGR